MDSLRLTTLTMLIPLGWAISADAYPRQLERLGSPHTPLQASASRIAECPDIATKLEDDLTTAFNGALEAIGFCDSRTALHGPQNPLRETCRMEFAPVEID